MSLGLGCCKMRQKKVGGKETCQRRQVETGIQVSLMLGKAFMQVTELFIHPSVNKIPPTPPYTPLFLSLLTHNLHPTYLGVRAKQHWLLLQQIHYSLKILLSPLFTPLGSLRILASICFLSHTY